MPTNIWTGATRAEWTTADNWSLAAVPVDGDDVIIDGRDTTAVNITVASSQGTIDLASLTIMSSFTKNIGTAALPLIIEISGDLIIEGAGSYYILSGAADATTDGTIDRAIINTSGSVFLGSMNNDGANDTDWGTVIVNSGTVVIYGDADTATVTTAESGTVIQNLILSPSYGKSGGVNVTIGDICYKVNGSVYPNIIMQGGTLTAYSSILQMDLYGGTATIGGTGYSMAAGDDNITTFNQYDGTLNWKPSVVSASVRTTASASPAIATANIYGGTFDGSSMLEKATTDPTITTLYQHKGSIINLQNGYANFIVTTYKKYGGTMLTSTGQALTLT